MPIKSKMWRLEDDCSLQTVQYETIDSEEKLENILERNEDVLGDDLIIIGRQVLTDYGTKIDMLALDEEGNLHVIENKRNQTARKTVAQVLDYASWVKELSRSDITQIFEEYSKSKDDVPDKLEKAFDEKFGKSIPESVNENHELIIVASELDDATERIINYLSEDYGVPLNTVFFRYFTDNGQEFLSRTWLLDPSDVDRRASQSRSSSKKKEPWNGKDYYVNVKDGEHRRWADCRKYGFISAGQGKWFSRTLKQLEEGDRIFVNHPGVGYVGAGIVTEERTPVKDFTVVKNGEETALLDLDLEAPKMGENAYDPEKTEYVVRVDWIKTVSKENAIWKKGMFGQQNTVCKLRNQYTIDILYEEFGIDEE